MVGLLSATFIPHGESSYYLYYVLYQVTYQEYYCFSKKLVQISRQSVLYCTKNLVFEKTCMERCQIFSVRKKGWPAFFVYSIVINWELMFFFTFLDGKLCDSKFWIYGDLAINFVASFKLILKSRSTTLGLRLFFSSRIQISFRKMSALLNFVSMCKVIIIYKARTKAIGTLWKQ